MQFASKADFELVPRNEHNSFAVREFRLPAFSSSWHFHPECELTLILRSSGKRFVGDSIERFLPGDLVLIGSNLPHYWRNDTPAKTPAEEAHSLVIHFPEECFGTGFLALPELNELHKLLLRARRGIVFSGAVHREMKAKMLQLKSESGFAAVIGLLDILHVLCQAREYQVLSSPGFNPYVDQFASQRITSAYQYVFEHFTEGFDYQQIAHKVGMSLSAFGHYFKRVTGRTLSEFVKEVRIGHARKLLIESDATVAEIAYASGYDSLSNFNRQFRELSKLNPKEYRREHGH